MGCQVAFVKMKACVARMGVGTRAAFEAVKS